MDLESLCTAAAEDAAAGEDEVANEQRGRVRTYDEIARTAEEREMEVWEQIHTKFSSAPQVLLASTAAATNSLRSARTFGTCWE